MRTIEQMIIKNVDCYSAAILCDNKLHLYGDPENQETFDQAKDNMFSMIENLSEFMEGDYKLVIVKYRLFNNIDNNNIRIDVIDVNENWRDS